MNKIMSFELNLKIKQYISTLKFKKGLKSKYDRSYLKPENYIKKSKDTPHELLNITITNAANHRFVCPCVTNLQSQNVS